MDKKIYIRDILKDDILANLTKEAAKDSYDNFHDFEKRRPDYLHYHLAEFVDTTIAMAGMFQSKQWPSNYVRVLDRCYYFKIARSSSLSFLNEKVFKETASKHFLPLHIKLSLEKNLIPFYSIAGIKRRPAMKRMIERWNATHEQKFVLLPKMYFTCNHSVKENTNEKCWQNIAILKIDGYDKFNLPSR